MIAAGSCTHYRATLLRISVEVCHDRACCRATGAHRAQHSNRGQWIQGDSGVSHCNPIWSRAGFEHSGMAGVAAQPAIAFSGDFGRNLAGLGQKRQPDIGVRGPKIADSVACRPIAPSSGSLRGVGCSQRALLQRLYEICTIVFAMPEGWDFTGERFGGPGRDRTDDLFHAMEARSQLRHRPTWVRRAIAIVPILA